MMNKTIYQDHNGIKVDCEIDGHKYLVIDEKQTGSNNKIISTVSFQNGPIKEFGVNGPQNEHLMAILINRISFLDRQFPCIENKQCLTHLQIAMDYLEQRTQDRLARNVEGENKL